LYKLIILNAKAYDLEATKFSIFTKLKIDTGRLRIISLPTFSL
jgi:hypothetical protein